MMKRFYTLITALSAALLLTQCVYKDTPYSFRAPTKEQKCLSQCKVRESQCNRLCINTAQKCNLKENKKARFAYNHYIHQQKIAGAPIARDFASYFDPLACKKVTCNCFKDAGDCETKCDVS
jgi:hypothetical protein